MNDKKRAHFIFAFVTFVVTFGLLAASACLIALNSRDAHTTAQRIFIAAACIMTGTAVTMLIIRRKLQSTRQKESLEAIIQNLNSMVILWDTSFGYIRVNDEFIKITGYTADDLRDPEIMKKVLPEDAFSGNLQGMSAAGGGEFFIQCKNGEKVYTVWNTSLMSTENTKDQEPIMMTIGRNLNEKKRLQNELVSYSEKLEESKRQYALSLELSEIGLVLKCTDSSRFYATDRLCKMLELIPENGFIDETELRSILHPADKAVFDSIIHRPERVGSKIRSVDFRARTTDGDYRWYNFRYKAIFGSSAYSMGGAVIDITSEKEKDLMIEQMAYVDEITGISNRNKFMHTGNELMRDAADNDGDDYWVIVIDIDNFHFINDIYGYLNGNILLKKVADIINVTIPGGGSCARIGGDNFALLIKADNDARTPVLLIQRIQRKLERISGAVFESQNITCSAGYCLMSDSDSQEFAQVLDRAEFALGLSRGERSAIIRFDNHLHNAVIEGNEFEKELARAIDSREMVLYYQPKINLENGKVMGMEALIRWIKPDGTVIPPDRFIPIAEKSMLITKISRFVLHEACRQNKAWQDMGLEPVTVSINLTAIDFYQTNVIEVIRDTLKETKLDPQWLDVELTESLALKDIEHAVSQMKEIKNLGVKLSMDDFGTGYSSLSYIQILPITILKLDRSFIMYLEEDEVSREIVSSVIRIAKSKKIETIAEGIETSGQAEILKKSGCDHAQGYFFGKPMPAKEFEQFLISRQEAKKNS